MEKVEEKLYLALIILPGFVSIGVASAISNIGEVPEFELVVWALAVTFVNLISTMIFFKGVQLMAPSYKAPGSILGRAIFVTILTILSLISGICIAAGYERDWLSRAARYLISPHTFVKYGDREPLPILLRHLNASDEFPIDGRDPVMSWKATYIRILLKDHAGVVEGAPNRWSSKGQEGQIFLSPACTVDGTSVGLIPGPGILVRTDEISIVSFFDASRSVCACRYEEEYREAAKLPPRPPCK